MNRNQSMASIRNSSSLANKYGVTCKENNSLGSLGMNPNLNLEDQYIENLLKQIHFLNLQVKLIKEKQQNSDSNALWSLLNRSKQPMMNNIVFSNKKYQSMKQQTSKQIHKLEHHITTLDSTQHSLLSQLKLLEDRKKIIQERAKSLTTQQQQKISLIQNQIKQHKKIYDKLIKQKKDQQEKKEELLNNLTKLENQQQKDQYNRQRQIQAIRHQQEIQEKIIENLDGKIGDIKSKIANLKKLFQSNEEYRKAAVQQQELKDKIGNLQKQIIAANFQIMQLGQSLKMADLQKQKQIRTRNNHVEKMQQNKLMLLTILQMNCSRKDKEAAHRKKQSPQIKKAQEQKFKLQKTLEDIKRKINKATQSQNSIHAQVHELAIILQKVRQTHKDQALDLSKLSQSNNQKEAEWRNINSEVNDLLQSYQKIQRQNAILSKQELELSRQIEYLKKKNDILRERVLELGPIINNLRIDDLTRTVKKNQDFNRTVQAVMSKWTQIKDFGRV